MTRIYDNWDRLVEATLRREELRFICQRTPSDLSASSSSSSFSFVSLDHPALSFEISSLLLGKSFTYNQILQATDSLSNTNLIKQGHSGDLYFGVLEGGIKVVIKKIDLLSLRTESHRYVSELEFLHKVPHPRLVPFLGHCFEKMYEKFLVYEYMPKKDLSSYLDRKIVSDDGHRLQVSPLDWKTRLKIAIGAAEGLCYLHHECVPPIAHRDLQPGSILLDENFEARLGSLSEVCTALERVAEQKSIARLFRLRNATGRVTKGKANATCADDVYCFGKVLLQLVTGRLRLCADGDFPDLISKTWKDLMLLIYDKKLVRNILDPALTVQEDLFMEVWAVAIVALACLNPKPSCRLQMAQVLKALKHGKINQSSYFEMTRTIEAYRSFYGPVSPRLFK